MKLLLLAALCALALATRTPRESWEREEFPEWDVKERTFRPEREYRFKYNGQLATGLPGSSKQHSATRIQALVSLVFKTEEKCILTIESCRIGRLNRHIPEPRAMIPFMAFEEVPIESELLQKLKVSVKFTYSKGMISEVVFDGREEPWSANIKRGILNLLQVNLHRHASTDLSEEALIKNKIERSETPDFDFFTVMEDTLEGQCETLYTVTKEPSRYYSSEPVLNVTKTINFEKCQKRPDIKYNFRFQDPCPTCEAKYNEDQKFLKSSTVAKYNISGTRDEFLIESAIVESQYHVIPFNRKENMITTYVNQTLVLLTSGPIRAKIQEPRNPKPSDSHLIFTPDWDIMKEEFFMKGEEEFLQKTPYSELKDKEEFVSNILRRLLAEMRESVKEEAPRQYTRLVKVLRMLKRSELERIHEKFLKNAHESFTPEEDKKIKHILLDAIADAGTKDCVFFLIEKIREREISPIRAALTIKSLINVRVVSQEMIQELLKLAESEVCQRNWFLKQSVYLTMGSMVNALCMPNEDKLAHEFKIRSDRFCPRSFKEEIVEKLFRKFEESQRFEEKVLKLKTIGNMGLDISIFQLEKIIKNVDARYSTMVRTEAVLALRQVREILPRKVQKICMPVFMTRDEPTELRIACAYQIFETLPERPILDQIARKLFTERSRQVASFVYTYMNTVSNSTNPCLKKFARDLQLSLRHGKRISYAFFPSYSMHLHLPVHSKQYWFGFDVDMKSVMSNYTSVPKMLAVDLHSNFFGFWTKHFLTFGVVTKDLDSLLRKYIGYDGRWSEMDLEDILVRNPRSARTVSPLNELKSLWSKLKTVQRSSPMDPKGYFYMKYKDQDYAMLPFSLEHITETFGDLINDGRINIREIERFLTSGYNFKFYKAMLLHEMEFKIPTTLGMPLVASLRIPTVMQMTGQIRASLAPENGLESLKVELTEVNPSLVSTVVTRVEVWSPIVNTGLKVLATAKVHVPMNGKLEVDLRRQEPIVKLTWTPPRESVNWITLETRPVTYTRLWPKSLTNYEEPEERTIYGEEWNREYNIRKDFEVVRKLEEFCERALGVRLRVDGHWQHTPQMHVPGTPSSPFSGPNKLAITTIPSNEMPKEWVAKFSGKLLTSMSSSLRPKFEGFSPLDSEEDEDRIHPEWREYETPRSWESVIKAEIFSKGSPKELKAELETRVKCGDTLRYCSWETTLDRSPIPEYDREPFKMCFDSEVLFPETPDNYRELTGKKVVSHAKLTWGRRSCENNKRIALKVQAERSDEQRRMVEEEPEYDYYNDEERCKKDSELCSPVSIYSSLHETSKLMHYKLEAEYQNVPVVVKNITRKVFRALKTYFYWQSKVADVEVRNPENKIKVDLFIDPRSKQHVNVTVRSPRENVTFRDIPLPMKLRPLSLRRSSPIRSFSDIYYDIAKETYPTCEISSRRVKTFDDVEYQVPITTCWSVLAKDCESETDPDFAVLIKKLSANDSKKKVKIITKEHKIELTPESAEYERVKVFTYASADVKRTTSEEDIKVWVNGEEKRIRDVESIVKHGHEIARIEKTGDAVKVVLPESGIRVYFDGYTAKIKMSPMLRNVQCGLCGHYDLEESDEFRSANYELSSDVRDFYRSYTLNEESCDYLEKDEDICETAECEYRRPSRIHKCRDINGDNDVEDSRECEEEYENEESREFEPVPRTKVIEQMSKICFSKTPVPVCPHHTYPKTYKPERKVVYGCLPREDAETEVLRRKVEVERRIPEEISSLPTSFHQEELVPETCSRF